MSMQQQITDRIRAGMEVLHLDVINESGNHGVPRGSETHFKVVIVSPLFEGLSLVQRHQKVYALLTEPLENGVHALALHTYTRREWDARREASPASPPCRGGSRRDGD